MATTLEDLTVGIKNRLATITGLRVNAVEPPAPSPPAAWPFLRTAEYDRTTDGGMRWEFSVYIIVGAQVEQNAQTNLMPYLAPTGTKSIKAAIEADPSLGGVADYVTVQRIDSVGSYEIGGNRYIGAVLVAEVLT